MFLGEHRHSLDIKGRVVLPARFRDQLTEAVVTSHRDTCLALWTPEEFTEQAKAMRERLKGDGRARSLARVFFASAQEVTPDRQGRVMLPPNLRELARLKPESEVVVTGVGAYVEIWDADVWSSQREAGVAEMQDVN